MKEEKKLVWRLHNMPTIEGIAKLVELKVIEPWEARKIVFKEE